MALDASSDLGFESGPMVPLMFANSAASSAGQDYTIGSVVLLPLMTIIAPDPAGVRSTA
jgi:hypothetical protein